MKTENGATLHIPGSNKYVTRDNIPANAREIQEGLTPEQREMLGLNPVANLGLAGDLRYLSLQYPRDAKAVA